MVMQQVLLALVLRQVGDVPHRAAAVGGQRLRPIVPRGHALRWLPPVASEGLRSAERLSRLTWTESTWTARGLAVQQIAHVQGMGVYGGCALAIR